MGQAQQGVVAVTQFIKVNDLLVNIATIDVIDCSLLESQLVVKVYINGEAHVVANQAAVDLVIQINPSILEGLNLKFIRHRWALHNLIGHPLLQILSWAGKVKLGFWIHDNTVPRPRYVEKK